MELHVLGAKLDCRRRQSSARISIASAMCKYEEACHVCTPSIVTQWFLPLILIINIFTSLVFWEQQGLQTFGQKIQITRPQASQPAFERHFAQLSEEYGYVHAVNLLGTKENETILTAAYERSLRNAPDLFGHNVNFTNFDFHNQVKLHGHDAIFQVFR